MNQVQAIQAWNAQLVRFPSCTKVLTGIDHCTESLFVKQVQLRSRQSRSEDFLVLSVACYRTRSLVGACRPCRRRQRCEPSQPSVLSSGGVSRPFPMPSKVGRFASVRAQAMCSTMNRSKLVGRGARRAYVDSNKNQGQCHHSRRVAHRRRSAGWHRRWRVRGTGW